MQASNLNDVQYSRTTKFPLVQIHMVGIDCSKEQLEIISMIWPTFINKKVNEEVIIDASAFRSSDVHRLSCILDQEAEELCGGYILLALQSSSD